MCYRKIEDSSSCYVLALQVLMNASNYEDRVHPRNANLHSSSTLFPASFTIRLNIDLCGLDMNDPSK